MYKYEFLTALKEQLVGLPKEDIEERISFYEEMINDRIDEGKSEEEAVAEIGTVDEVVKEIAGDTKLVTLVKHKMTPKRSLRGWEIAIIIGSFPFWLPVVLVSFVLALVGFILLWTLVIVTYTVETALWAGSAMSGISFVMTLTNGEPNFAMLGMCVMALGGAILMIFGCYGSTKLTIGLTKRMMIGIKAAFIRKGGRK
ncbi:MAG: DUF1700 domain-containing protein [Bacilli bacterium]|nr:DUF1700 domain-containing protein [Bacilli bacterium]